MGVTNFVRRYFYGTRYVKIEKANEGQNQQNNYNFQILHLDKFICKNKVCKINLRFKFFGRE